MLKSKIFIKKTKRGKIVKIVREHYLRDDITCGSAVCTECEGNPKILEDISSSDSDICSTPHYLVLDTNVVLHQIDALDDPVFKNVVILQTVVEEVRHRSPPAYKRLKDILSNSDKHFYVFSNEFHKDTYIERKPGESSNDCNDRAIRHSVTWYQKHLCAVTSDINVILLTNDAENKKLAQMDGILALTIHEYVRSLRNGKTLLDRLAVIGEAGDSYSASKTKFPEHLLLSAIQRGIKQGKYCQGTFNASRDNYLEGYVSVPGREKWVFVQGLMNLNRAVHEDVVAIELLDDDDWTCPSSVILEQTQEERPDSDFEKEETVGGKKKIPIELREPTCRVIGIIRRKWRQYCGILQPSLIKESLRHLFVAAERRIPKIRIQTRQSALLSTQRIVVAIDSWPRGSRYPLGHFVRSLGQIGEKNTENEVLLLEHDVPHTAFSESVLSFLPKLPWVITDEDMKKRRDLRGITICSVDPPGCTDIDDALHCRKMDNGNLEVGVHIADVSHFIRPGNAMDAEAANRGTTVYLTDKRIDMVPDLLSSNLCSLRGNEERFAFSVIWEMTEEAVILHTTYTKSVIKSAAALTYGQAQMRIDDKSMNDDITLGLRGLNRLAKILKRRRKENGALTLASPEIRFTVDSETHDPIDVQTKELQETNSMVEEFMLLGNISVAEKILSDFPDCSVLRRHPKPPLSNFDPLIKAALSKGFSLNVSEGKLLADSLDAATIPDDPYFNTMLRIMATRCMMQAVYFSSGMEQEEDYAHYGLAAPIYTHFTSPIRRYSDIMVHRLLAVAIGADVTYPDLMEKRKTSALCNNLNFRHRMGQYAGRASVNLHTHLFFKNRKMDEPGYILFVRRNAIQILIPKFGLEGTLYLHPDRKKRNLFSFDEETNTQRSGDVTLKVFDAVTVAISIDQSNVQHLKLDIKLIKPHIPGFSPDVHEDEREDAGPPTKKRKS